MGKELKKSMPGKGAAQKNSKKKRIIISAISVVAVAAVVAGTVMLWPKKAPDAKKMSQEDALKYAASKEFAALPTPEKMRFSEQMREKSNPWEMFRNNNLTDDQKKQLRENMGAVMHQRMEERAKKLLAMTKEERAKEYDRMADEIKQRMANRQPGQGGPGGPGGGRGPGGGGQNIARMQQRYEGTSSDTRAIMAEMRKEIQKRIQNNPNAPHR